MNKLSPTKECIPHNISDKSVNTEQHENILDFLKMLFSEDVVDYSDYNQPNEMTFL